MHTILLAAATHPSLFPAGSAGTILSGVAIIVLAGLVGAAVRGVARFFRQVRDMVAATEHRSKQLETNGGSHVADFVIESKKVLDDIRQDQKDTANALAAHLTRSEEVEVQWNKRHKKVEKRIAEIRDVLESQNVDSAADRRKVNKRYNEDH